VNDTARTRAIAAAVDAYWNWQPSVRPDELVGRILDAVPDQMLADLLIERGALTEAGGASYREYGDYVVVPGDAHWALGTPVKVYRLTPKDPDHE